MRLPDKVTSFNESILSKISPTLELLSRKNMTLTELYSERQKLYGSIEEFIDTLDVLFALHKIDYCENEGVISFAVRDSVRAVLPEED